MILKLVQIILYILLVIIPMLYFLHLLKKESLLYKCLVVLIALFSGNGIWLKFYFHPNNLLFEYFVIATQVQLWFLYILFLIIVLYRFLFRFIRHKPFRKGHILIIILTITLTASGFTEHYMKRRHHYDVTINKQSSMKNLKLCVVSDFHIGTGSYLKTVDNFVSRVNSEHYDAILMVGDIFDENTPDALIPQCLESFSHLKSTYGTYAIAGNHEYYRKNTNFLNDLNKYHIHYLRNHYIEVDEKFNIVGFNDHTSHDHYNINQVIANMNKSLPTITLDHNPDRYKKYHDFTDLQLSGHTHNGQIFPGNIFMNLYFDYSYGQHQYGHEDIIVTSGMGSWGFPFRLGTQAEYCDINLQFSKK